MDKNEFITNAKMKYLMSEDEGVFIEAMTYIIDYFHVLKQEFDAENIENVFNVKGSYPHYSHVNIGLGDNNIQFKRTNHIEINFISKSNNQYTQANESLHLDNLVINDGQVLSESYLLEPSDKLMENYLPYLLA